MVRTATLVNSYHEMIEFFDQHRHLYQRYTERNFNTIKDSHHNSRPFPHTSIIWLVEVWGAVAKVPCVMGGGGLLVFGFAVLVPFYKRFFGFCSTFYRFFGFESNLRFAVQA